MARSPLASIQQRCRLRRWKKSTRCGFLPQCSFGSSGVWRTNRESGGIVVGNLGSQAVSNQVVVRVCTDDFVGDRTRIYLFIYLK